jgi:hypothetical protein
MSLVRQAVVAIDARTAATARARDRADAAGWVASNLLAARGHRVVPGPRPARPCSARMHASQWDELLAAVASRPALIDPATLPVRWLALARFFGLPLLDRPADEALADGACVLEIDESPE